MSQNHTIESNLTRMADAFERIAGALEKIASSNGSGDIRAVVSLAATETVAAPAPTSEPEKPKKAKAEKAEKAEPAQAPAAEEKTFTHDDIRAVVRKLIAGSVKEAEIAEVFKEIAGVQKTSQIPEDKLAAVHAKLTEMLP